MITLEILIDDPVSSVEMDDISVCYEIDSDLKSDRDPSLWQSEIINKHRPAVLIHVFDCAFKKSTGPRWLYEDVVDKKWRRFRFINRIDMDFSKLINNAINASNSKRVWIMTDAQYGPAPKLYSNQSKAVFLSFYRRFGLRLNSAVCVTDR